MFRKLILFASLHLNLTAAISQTYVTLYEDCNYSGRQYNLEAGIYNLYKMKIDNDKLSCLQIPAGMKVTIYEHDNFKGRSQTFSSNVRCLDNNWNDQTSSIVVENQNYRHQYNQNDYVVFYNDCNGRGYSQSLLPGRYRGSELGALKLNISSFTIYGNLSVKAYMNNENLSGYYKIYDASVSCLDRDDNDRIASLLIEYRRTQPIQPIQPNYQPGGTGWHVTVYTDCNYRGNSLRLVPGNYQGDELGLLSYNISSVEIPSTLKARVYTGKYLNGTNTTLNENISCLNSTLNDRIGSLVIEENNSNYNYNNNNNNQYQPYNNERVILYTDGRYKGQSASLLPGTYNSMAQAGFPDNALSSLTVPPGYRVVLFEFENFGGKSYSVTSSMSGFSLSSWNDITSSIKVFRDK